MKRIIGEERIESWKRREDPDNGEMKGRKKENKEKKRKEKRKEGKKTEGVERRSPIPLSHYQSNRTEPKRNESFFRKRIIQTTTECASIRSVQDCCVQTTVSRIRFYPDYKRTEAHRGALL